MFFIVLFNSPCIHLYSGEGPFLPNSGYKTRSRLGLNHTWINFTLKILQLLSLHHARVTVGGEFRLSSFNLPIGNADTHS